MNKNNFYGKFTSGAVFPNQEKKFFSKRNINFIEKVIYNNCKRMGLNRTTLNNKIIMNVGSGREALGFLQFNPKKYFTTIHQK